MPRKVTCSRCGERISGQDAWIALNAPYWNGLCDRCMADSFGCPRCGRWVPKSEDRGSYCRECRSAYNREYAARRRGSV
jgi:hypothetical protein